ncbi:MAG TPA: response regulator [Terriglobales bacterium]|nr:response regulator [Terriglobales bacterium]
MPENAKNRVLIIDPDPRLAETRCLMLRSHGVGAEYVADGNAVLNSWKPRAYDLVLVDVQHNADYALKFCSELKERDVAQLVALISDHHVWIPPHPCPDEVISRSEGPKRFVEKVIALLDEKASSNAGASRAND